jgi:hypothetical protein
MSKGGNHGDSKAANGGAPQHQESGGNREAEADDCASPQAHADGLGQAGRQNGPPKTPRVLTQVRNPSRVLLPSNWDIENGALAVDQEQGEIARFHWIGEALKRRKVGDGLAV